MLCWTDLCLYSSCIICNLAQRDGEHQHLFTYCIKEYKTERLKSVQILQEAFLNK
jgi:hypothetical protein